MEKLDLTTPDLTAANIERIAELFPNVITESRDTAGKVTRAIDFDLLRQELSDEVVEGPTERYRLDWPGKRAAAFAANAPINKTLRPVRDDSVDFDTTQNLFIEGDNLDALKLLQESYLGKVKLIYIDPPYNTGHDFIYKDNFAQSKDEYLEASGQTDEEGNRLVANTEANGRFHSDWLSMIYPRLKLARNLLAEDGVIFVSIDDGELSNLRKLCDEVFGQTNYVSTLAVEMSKTQGMKVAAAQSGKIVKNHEYVVVYARSSTDAILDRQPLHDASEVYDSHYDIIWSSGAEPTSLGSLLETDALSVKAFERYGLTVGKSDLKRLMEVDRDYHDYFLESIAPFLYRESPISLDNVQQLDIPLTEIVEWGKYLLRKNSKGKVVQLQPFLDGVRQTDDYVSTRARATIRGALWKGFHSDMMNVGKEGSIEFKNGKKPVRLIRQIMKWANRPDAVILDFFAGSGTTAHAVMAQNAADGGNRRFIMVQLDEATDPKSAAHSAGYETIAELSRERIRRAGQKIKDEAGLSGADLDVGFRALRIDSTNMADVLRTPDETAQPELDQFEGSTKGDRTSEDLLFQVLLDWGLELSMPIEVEQLEAHEVFTVEDGALIACFDTSVTPDLARTIAKRGPLRAVFRDSAFKSDDARINVEQIFKELSPDTDVRVI